jgi:hypothetical protein
MPVLWIVLSFHPDTDHDIEKLIEKTEQQGDQEEPEKKDGLSFAFAKIWAADKDSLEEMDDTIQSNDKDDSWAQTLAVSHLCISRVDYNIDYRVSVSPRSEKRFKPKRSLVEVCVDGLLPFLRCDKLLSSRYTF